MEQVTTRGDGGAGVGRNVLERCRSYVSGGLPPGIVLGLLCPSIILCFVIPVALAVASYPTSFDVRHQWISSLASARRNPTGYFYMGAGLTAVAVLLIPLHGYLSRGSHAFPVARSLGALLFWIGIAALLLLGLETTAFPNYGRNRPIHRLLSAVTLTGLTLGFAALTISRARATPGGWRRAGLACGVLLAPAVGAALAAVTLHIGEGASGWAISRQAKQTAPFFHTLAFWEWAAVTGLFAGGYLCAWAVSLRGASVPAIEGLRYVESEGGRSPTRG